MKTQSGQAIPFIEVEEDYSQNKAFFSINPVAIAMLQELKERKISIVTFVGPLKSAKSDLANHLLGRKDGFVAESATSVQRGIWLWTKAIQFREDDSHDTVILSCQGIGAETFDKTLDAKLLTLCALFSSTLVYSAAGEIDEDILEHLHHLNNIPQFIDLKIDETSTGNYSSFFSSLLWVVDELYHGNKASSEHLEEALGNYGLGESNKNIKENLKNLFANRRCFYYEPKYNSFRNLKPSQGDMFAEDLLDNLKPKTIYNKPITCSMLLNLSFEFLDGLNSDAPIPVYSIIDRASYAETRKVADDLTVEYHEKADEIFNEDRMPFEEEAMRAAYKGLSTDILQRFENITKDFAETTQLLELRSEMAEKFEKDFEETLKNNRDLSSNLCKRILSEFINSFDIGTFSNLSQMSESLLNEQKEKFIYFYENYKEFAKGSSKYDIFADTMPSCLFDFFDKYTSNYKRLMNNELAQVTLAYQELKASEEASKKTVFDNLDSLINAQREKEEIKNQYEKVARDNSLFKLVKEQEISSLKEEIAELQKKLEKKKEKKSKLKEEKNQLKEKSEGFERKISELLINESRLKDEINYIKANPKAIGNTPSTQTDNSVLVASLRQEIDGLKKLLQQAIQNAVGLRDSQTQILDKEAEIAQTKEEFSKRLDENFKKIQQMKSEFNKERDALKKERDQLQNENVTLRVSLASKTEALTKKEQDFLTIKNEYEKNKADYEVKLRDYKVSVEVTSIFKKTVEDMNTRIQDNELKMAELKSHISMLETISSDMIFASREALKKALKQKNHLKQAIEGLNPQISQEFKDMLQDIGIKPE